jgi:hypothetical protein
MTGRAQVILVITGLGAPTLEEVMPGIAIKIDQAAESRPKPQQQPVVEVAAAEPTREIDHLQAVPMGVPQSVADNLDIPAFLRRRNR